MEMHIEQLDTNNPLTDYTDYTILWDTVISK